MNDAVLNQINEFHKSPDLKTFSTMDLLITREEAVSSRDDLRFFFAARFYEPIAVTDSNPAGFPFLNNAVRSEAVSNKLRMSGYHILNTFTELDFLIQAIDAEIISRTK